MNELIRIRETCTLVVLVLLQPTTRAVTTEVDLRQEWLPLHLRLAAELNLCNATFQYQCTLRLSEKTLAPN